MGRCCVLKPTGSSLRSSRAASEFVAEGEMTMLEFLVAGAVGYLVGAVPTGVLVGRVFTGRDVRRQGSGHTGGLNVYRLAGLGPMLLTAVVDVLLGVAAVALSRLLSECAWASRKAGSLAKMSTAVQVE